MLILLGTTKLFSQDVITGGNMENATSWKTCTLNMDTANSVDYEFNYTTTTPSAGAGGCLYVSGTNVGATGGNLTSMMFYQQLTLHRGTTYNFDGAYKDVRTNNYWCEVYIGGIEPAVGADYTTAQGAVFLSGFKSTNWETNCPADEFDGTFSSDACTPGTSNTVLFEGTGDTTVYFGFRMGIWDDGSNGYTFEVYLDNISLTAGAANSMKLNDQNISVSPNPVSDILNISGINAINDLKIVNVLGQTVYSASEIGLNNISIDFSGFSKGLYMIIAVDNENRIGMAKVLKQ